MPELKRVQLRGVLPPGVWWPKYWAVGMRRLVALYYLATCQALGVEHCLPV